MTERRSPVRAALHAFVAVAAALLIVHGIAHHPGVYGASPAAAQIGPAGGAPAPQEADQNGCPDPWEHLCSAACSKPSPPPSRQGGRPARGAAAASAAPARRWHSGAGVTALRWARPAGPRLPVFRC